MRTVRTQAVVLRRTNYGEADRILQLLTPDGRRSVMARGVRKEKSRLAGGIELFALCDVVLGEGKGDLGVLTSARLVQFYRHILQDYDRMQFGYEVIKHITKASEMIDEPDWFDVITEVFAALDAVTIPRQLIETWFYLRHAALLGYELNLTHDVDGNRLQANQRYRYDVSEKNLRLAQNGDVTSAHIKFLRLINAKSIQVLVQVGGISDVLPECWSVARQHAAI